VNSFRMRTQRYQEAPPPETVPVDWFAGREGSTVQVRQSLTMSLAPTVPAMDFFRCSVGVYCADRLSLRPGTWTRSIELEFPVGDVDSWRSVTVDLCDALSFLSGDAWHLAPFSDNVSGSTRPPIDAVDAVCLFSGGLDSFTGALDLLAEGKRVCLVAHYEGGQAPEAQSRLAQHLTRRFGRDRIVLRRLFLRPAPPAAGQARLLPDIREPSTRSRSLLFLGAGLLVASGYGPNVPLYIPENGFIGINVPLTAARSGSFSTRTTHPHFMDALSDCVRRLGISNPVINPFRVMTKGEIIAGCRDQTTMRKLARETLSCAHPEAARYASREQGNCGYCFPCLIRRSALHHVALDDPADYAFNALQEDTELTGDRGSDLRALIRSLSQRSHPIDILRNGPVPAGDLKAFADAYERGRREIRTWMSAANPSAEIRRQLPRS
jgi:7-cyano-7-deazaguanine synthase in queuosine biosynthesis